jgi:hypothetical protein
MAFDLFLSKDDADQIRRLQRQLLVIVDQNRLSTPAVDNLLKEFPLSPSAKEFGPLYVGLVLAKLSQNKAVLPLAIQAFRKNLASNNPYSRLLADYLERQGSFTPPAPVFSTVTPFDAWKKSSLYSAYMKGVTAQTLLFAEKFPPQNSVPVIVDIGTGSGVLIANIINHLAQQTGLKSVHLILNDQSNAMLESATGHCYKNLVIPAKITTHEGRVENISTDDLFSLSGGQSPWFVIASASAHHMPKDEKIQTLKTLSQWTPNVLIGEFEANNDLPEPDSPELFYSVASFYGYLFKDILEGPATEEEKKATIEQFLLAESIIMLKSNKRSGSAEEGGRVDYHTTSEEWMTMAMKAGLVIERHETLVRIPEGRPVTFFLHFRKRA